jgi:hypothetical protein
MCVTRNMLVFWVLSIILSFVTHNVLTMALFPSLCARKGRLILSWFHQKGPVTGQKDICFSKHHVPKAQKMDNVQNNSCIYCCRLSNLIHWWHPCQWHGTSFDRLHCLVQSNIKMVGWSDNMNTPKKLYFYLEWFVLCNWNSNQQKGWELVGLLLCPVTKSKCEFRFIYILNVITTLLFHLKKLITFNQMDRAFCVVSEK